MYEKQVCKSDCDNLFFRLFVRNFFERQVCIVELMTVRQFADDQHCSVSAVRQQMQRYRKELEGHVIRKPGNKTFYLDDFARDLLAQHRRANPTAIMVQAHQEEYQDLKDENERLKAEINSLKDRLLEATGRIATAAEDRTKALEQINHLQQLTLETQNEVVRLTAEAAKAQGLEMQLSEAQAIAQSYQPFLFGLYRRVPIRKELDSSQNSTD